MVDEKNSAWSRRSTNSKKELKELGIVDAHIDIVKQRLKSKAVCLSRESLLIIEHLQYHLERVGQTAVDCLDDLSDARYDSLKDWEDGKISKKEYIDTMYRYKGLRDALWHAGFDKEVEEHKERNVHKYEMAKGQDSVEESCEAGGMPETIDAIGVWIVGHDAYPVAVFRYQEHAEEWGRDNYFGQWLTKEVQMPANTLFEDITEERWAEIKEEAKEMAKIFEEATKENDE